MDATPVFTLRPLGIGEIFDRAVTIYVRNFTAFTLIVLTLLVPIAIVQYFVIPDQAAALIQEAGKAGQASKSAQFPFTNREIVGLLVILGMALLGASFTNNAVAVGVARVYNGGEPAYGACYATVFRRWLPLLGTALLNLLILIGAYLASTIGLVIVVTPGIALVRSAPAIAIAIFIIAALLFLAVIVLFLLLVLAYAFALYSTSLEDASPAHAIALAYRRLFNRAELKKALLMTLAYVGLEIGVLTLSSTVGIVLLLIVKSYALQLAVNAVISAMLTAFLTILLAVYYYDVRTRAEGLDLETDLQRLTAASP